MSASTTRAYFAGCRRRDRIDSKDGEEHQNLDVISNEKIELTKNLRLKCIQAFG